MTLVGAAVVLVTSIAGSACSQPSPPRGHVVDVSLRDFHIGLSSGSVGAGTVTFAIHSRGPTTHEFNVIRTDLPPASLPLRLDGITVNEDSPALHLAGSEEDIALGETTELTIDLPPGHYVLYCNMEGHYMAGMHIALDAH